MKFLCWDRLGFPKRRGNQFNQQQSPACWIIASTLQSVIWPYEINLYVSYDSHRIFNWIYVIILASVVRYHRLQWNFGDIIGHIRPTKNKKQPLNVWTYIYVEAWVLQHDARIFLRTIHRTDGKTSSSITWNLRSKEISCEMATWCRLLSWFIIPSFLWFSV